MLNQSCTRCTTRKIRCDGQTPCENCNKRNMSSACVRSSRKNRPRSMEMRESRTAKIQRQNSSSTPVLSSPPLPLMATSMSCYSAMTFHQKALKVTGDVDKCIAFFRTIFIWRIHPLSFAVLHIPDLFDLIRRLHKQADCQTQITRHQVGLIASVMALSLLFTPKEGEYAHLYEMAESLSPEMGPSERQEYSLQLARDMMTTEADPATMELLQSALLLSLLSHPQHLTDNDDDTTSRATSRSDILYKALRAAIDLGAHRISTPFNNESLTSIREESLVRCW